MDKKEIYAQMSKVIHHNKNIAYAIQRDKLEYISKMENHIGDLGELSRELLELVGLLEKYNG